MESSFVIIFNGVGMLFCFVVGLLIANWGYKIYKNNNQSSNDKQHIQWGEFTISSKGSGSIVITSAVIWAIIGFYVSPSITQTEYGPNYTSIINKKNEQFMIVSHAVGNPIEAMGQPDVLTNYLSNELAQMKGIQKQSKLMVYPVKLMESLQTIMSIVPEILL